ncbi:5-methylcytosine-specific restriction endonuclease system specificity protein McrC [Niallia endozanthoxylica]|uniref:5-methylcytosine-specific restriction endonuclease system specificity protein McrC n=1 Tax=Niallia endozanthoxylica TaxID=2036016 RepID=A0A5J5HSF8_9BACI|nr:5-methylcytosine-specific restriction endonuclease system specificity protein McrC [Niallia endozanthoxylica]KAA9022937.1 5-methylcytosine-specific restriction endonuclease system specificity protein McrC [Niallia endozanthoxylica]
MNSLKELSKIPVKNIYYMLCYAWGHLTEKDMTSVAQEDEKDIHHLLTRILVVKIRSLIKRGFYREYRANQEEMSLLRGKVLFSQSVHSFSFKRGKMQCEYEELNLNILHNQIIKTTLHSLLRVQNLDQRLLNEVQQLHHYFAGIDIIPLYSKVFSNITLHRSNQHYRFVLDICQFLYESLLIHEDGDERSFSDFERDAKRMPRLFEEFVRNFYKAELPDYRVKRDRFHWDAVGDNLNYLPSMETDISLENQSEKWIIDTKFYQDTVKGHWGSEKLISGNLYQLYSYLSNYKDKSFPKKELKGMLLYPLVGHSLDLSYEIKGYPIKVCTVDLNQNWQQIHHRLLEIIC